ncbi:MAG TPA: NTF2 fold immunity protein [Alphaproteobacteria bacterium]|nr:NTF2 fold immunity protein [Alphaproteobacteria bacterium]
MLSMVQACHGGVVFNADVAAKLGEVLCEAQRGKDKLEHLKPLSVVEKDGYWRVESSGRGEVKARRSKGFGVLIARSNGRVTDSGDIVFDADLAVKIGEVLCEAHYGEKEIARQRPLLAIDKGGYWRVEGSFNRDRKIDGPAAFFLSIEKEDGRVSDIGKWLAYHPHPSVVPLIREHYRKKKAESGE